ncbi:hypothetical protein [Agromyces sp. SYSU T00194]|uniref:hypothetical protein n=1 Tax=Agromyces chitinivorans TaxID=3158560 RepID=UPI00339744E2
MPIAARTLSAVAVSVALAVGLTGCFGNPLEQIVNRGVEEAIEGATGGAVGVGEMPAGWPAEVPVVEGEVLFGASGTVQDDSGWAVTIRPESSDPLEQARQQLAAAGFQEDTALAETGGSGVVAFSNPRFDVFVTAASEGIVYVVVPAGQ